MLTRNGIIIVIILFFSIIIIKLINYYKSDYCYEKCSMYHYRGTGSHWYYKDFIINDMDTIWIDQECYNDWCICIDECSPGLCCELLKK
jgi:hypothetical protein